MRIINCTEDKYQKELTLAVLDEIPKHWKDRMYALVSGGIFILKHLDFLRQLRILKLNWVYNKHQYPTLIKPKGKENRSFNKPYVFILQTGRGYQICCSWRSLDAKDNRSSYLVIRDIIRAMSVCLYRENPALQRIVEEEINSSNINRVAELLFINYISMWFLESYVPMESASPLVTEEDYFQSALSETFNRMHRVNQRVHALVSK